MKKILGKLVSIAACALLCATSASASIVSWDWNASASNGDTGFGTFTTDGEALTPTAMLDITGFWKGGSIIGLVPNPLSPDPSNNGAFQWDNLFQAASPQFDWNGVLFSVDNGLTIVDVNYYFEAGGPMTQIYYDENRALVSSELRFTASHESLIQPPTNVPEPATSALVPLALIGMTFMMVRRRRAQTIKQ